MPLGKTVKRAQLLKIKAQMSSIWASGCMFDECVCVIRLGMTTAPWWRKKVMVNYYCTLFYNEIWLPEAFINCNCLEIRIIPFLLVKGTYLSNFEYNY